MKTLLGIPLLAALALSTQACADQTVSADVGADTAVDAPADLARPLDAQGDTAPDAPLAQDASADLQPPRDASEDLLPPREDVADSGGLVDAVAPPDSAPDAASDADVRGFGCVSDGCGTGERCNEWTGRCQPAASPYPPPGGDNGASCTMESDCRSAGNVLGETYRVCNGLTGAGGSARCVSFCSLTPGLGDGDRFQRNGCPVGSVCHPDGVGSTQIGRGNYGVCVPECMTNSDCTVESGDFCRHTFGTRTLVNGYCAPSHCRSRPCSLTLHCSC